jgi:ABC-type branched-subunit amino acid transport system substrate-binding protein
VLGIFSLFGDAVLPVLEEAGIPYAGNTILSASDSSNPMAFPFDGGVVGAGAAVGQQMAVAGCANVGAIGYDNAASTLYMSWVEIGAADGGAAWVGDVRVPAGNPDYGPAVASIVSQGADCVFVSLPPAEAAKLLGAIAQSGEDLRVGTGVTTIPQQVISAVPAEATEGAILVSSNPTTQDADFPGVQEYIDEMSAAGVAEEQINGSYGLASYARAQVLFNAMKTIDGDITKESVHEALSSITDPGTPLFGQFSTTEEFPQEGFNRLFNFTTLVYSVEGQQLSLTSNEYADVTELVRANA